MPLALGATNIDKVYLGSTEVTKAYLGSTLVFEAPAVGNPVFNISGLAFYYTTAEDTTVRADNDPVALITDLRPSGSVSFSNTGTARPTWKTGGVNSKPYLFFDGIDDALNGSSAIFDSGDSPMTLFLLFRRTGTQSEISSIFTSNSGAGFGNTIAIFQAFISGQELRAFMGGDLNLNDSTSRWVGGKVLYSLRYTLAQTLAQSWGLVNSSASRSTSGLDLGATSSRIAPTGNTFELYSVIGFTRNLTDPEVASVRVYLETLYGDF